MTRAQIACFMEVAKYRSFSQAASHMFISQPAVSKQVSQLEKTLGLTLIDRSASGAELTEPGRLVYQLFQRFYTDLESTLEEARRISSGKTGTIRLGCLDGWGLSTFYPELQGILEGKYPHLQIDLNGYNHVTVLDALRRGEIDVAITLEFTLWRQQDLAMRNITVAPAAVLISTQHPLAQKGELTLADLRDGPFYVVAPVAGADNPMERLTVQVCRDAGFSPKIEHFPSSAAILMRLQSGVGAQVTCAWTSACKLPLYRVLYLDEQLHISAAWLENDVNPAKRVFLEELYRHYQDKE